MYEETFDDGEGLTQETAMFRAYALGVDAAFGNTYPEEVRRLTRSFNRALVQIAFDEGKSRAEDEIRKRGGEPERAGDDAWSAGEYEGEIWEELVSEKRDDEDAFEMVQVRRSRDSLPSALQRPDFLDRADPGTTTIELPRFLRR